MGFPDIPEGSTGIMTADWLTSFGSWCSCCCWYGRWWRIWKELRLVARCPNIASIWKGSARYINNEDTMFRTNITKNFTRRRRFVLTTALYKLSCTKPYGRVRAAQKRQQSSATFSLVKLRLPAEVKDLRRSNRRKTLDRHHERRHALPVIN